ncbi:MAG: TGS domain-containing protein [Thermofilum sp.]|uniref:DUF933 domain-containing protein n=1 Tax=Thermofilum pendens TaxID=2269 RepID=A0A7C4D1B3_THEPE
MPANLPPEARAKWRRVMEARSPEEKLIALQEFLSAVPKHKGTERLRMQVTRQIASLRREIEERKKRKGGGEHFFLEKEGDIQVVLLGLPGSGKTEVFNCLAGLSVLDEPRKPVPGVRIWEGVYFQLVNTPPLIEGADVTSRVLALARNADALIVVINTRMDVYYQLSVLSKLLEEGKIAVKKPRCTVTIERKATGGIVLVGRLVGATLQELAALLRDYGVHHAIVRIEGEATLDDVEEALFGSTLYKPTLLVSWGGRLADSASLSGVPVVSASSCESLDFSSMAHYFLRSLDLIRVYTRNPKTGVVETRPVLVKRGTRVVEVAKIIHSDLYENFKFAKVWSTRFEFNPRRVGRDYVPEDGDVVEIVA